MGFLDRLKRKDDSGAFQDMSQVDPEEALRKASEGLAATDTYLDQQGNRRKLPEGAKDPTAEALEQAREQLKGPGAGGDGG
jgi:hypothetical protein